MSYPPPPGTAKSNLPPKPPTSIHAFSSFKPRSVTSHQASSSPHIVASAAPSHANFTSPGTYGPSYGGYSNNNNAANTGDASSAHGYQSGFSQTSMPAVSYGTYAPGQSQPAQQHQQQPQIHSERRQFVPRQTGAGGYGHNNGGHHHSNPSYPPLDPEMEAQIAEQQSIYDPAKRANANGGVPANSTTTTSSNYDTSNSYLPESSTSNSATNTNNTTTKLVNGKKVTVVRSGGGESWKDDTLLEWNPAHFRLFVGNLAGEVTDESLLKAFAAYPSVQRARVIRDKRTTKSKGYGFVAFEDGDEFFRAAREMQGKYIGSHPVLLKKSTTEIRPTAQGGKKGKFGGKGQQKNGKGLGKNGILGKKSEGGIKKKEKGPKLLG